MVQRFCQGSLPPCMPQGHACLVTPACHPTNAAVQGAGLRGGLPLASREASRACSVEGSFRGGLRCWSGEGLDQLAAAGLALPVLPRPVLAYTGRHHSLLERRCQEALSILDRVQRPAPLRRGAPATGGSLTPQLPKTAFRFAKVGPWHGCCIGMGWWIGFQ